MQNFVLHVGMNARAYTDIEVQAETLEQAKAAITPEFIACMGNIHLTELDTDEVDTIGILNVTDADGKELQGEAEYVPDAEIALRSLTELDTHELIVALVVQAETGGDADICRKLIAQLKMSRINCRKAIQRNAS